MLEMAFLQASRLILSPGDEFTAGMVQPEEQSSWMPDEDLDVVAAEFEASGLEAALHRYRLSDLDWEVLAPFQDRPLEVPALFIGGDKDLPTLWGRDALLRMSEVAPNAHDPIIIDDCGHWIQQEKAEEFNQVLLDFLSKVRLGA